MDSLQISNWEFNSDESADNSFFLPLVAPDPLIRVRPSPLFFAGQKSKGSSQIKNK